MTHYHLIGIGGSGLSAIARMLLEAGHTVSGCDRAPSQLAEALRAAGASVYPGHDPAHLDGVDVVIRSSAIPEDNPEVQAARQRNLPLLKRDQFLGDWMADKIGLAVAGTHGKTTTSGMLAWTLHRLGEDPTFIVGGVLQNLGVNAHAGQGRHFVIEADEYDRMFLGLKPQLAIVTNVEHDHPDCYPTFVDMVQAFERFVRLLPFDGTLIACADDAGARALIGKARQLRRRTVAYSLPVGKTIASPLWTLARNPRLNDRGGISFDVFSNLTPEAMRGIPVDLQLPGDHNVRNALAVLSAVMVLGLSPVEAARALGEFSGTGRRFEIRGEWDGITVIDDYAHHPTEIRATLEAARQRYPQARIWALWQPHTYSRTRTLAFEFAQAFAAADRVLVTEIYAARETAQGFSGADIAAEIQHPAVHFVPTHEAAVASLLEALRPGDVLLVLSAGDAVEISARVAQSLQERMR